MKRVATEGSDVSKLILHAWR